MALTALFSLSALSLTNILYLFLTSYLILTLSTVVYNLYLHPLRHFPGPRLAAASSLFQIYHNLLRGGQLTNTLPYLHSKYGPVIRVAPNELHFSTLVAYNAIYSSDRTLVKPSHIYDSFGNPHTTFTLLDPTLARARRAITSPHFSRRNILRLQNEITPHISALTEMLQKPGPHDIYRAYRSMTADVASKFVFGSTFNALDHPRYSSPFIVGTEKMKVRQWWVTYFPPLNWLLLHAVPKLLVACGVGLGDAGGFAGLIFESSKAVDVCLKGGELYKTAIVPGLKEKGLGREELVGESMNLVFAGGHMAGNTLTIGTARLVQAPGAQQKLYEELCTIWPDLDSPQPPCEALEKLPYLSGVVKESLRVAAGVPGPLPRLATKELVIDGHFIPAGTIVDVGSKLLHFDPVVFPDPETFVPERWNVEDTVEMDKHVVSYSRGSRSCIGASLANGELYMTFAQVFRKLRLELDGFREEDIFVRDYVNVHFAGRHVHVNVAEKREV